ncbi:MAG: hypothetical protein ACRETA_12800 [Gammaproteobacteria bacterium]
MSVSMRASAASSADALIDARVVRSTKVNYQGKIKQIKQYYTKHLRYSDLTLPIQWEDIHDFFGWLINIEHKDKPLAFSTVRQYKSALMWYYKEHKLIMQPEIDQGLEALFNGYKRRVSDYKLQGKMPVFEGKYHLTFDGYCLLATALFKADSLSQMLFGWPFLVLQWNLIARSDTVSCIMMEHVGWEADSLLITTPKHKGDQEGVKCFSRHLYANPLNPVICPVLALAIVTFMRVLKHDHLTESSGQSSSAALPNYRIFDGAHNEKRFSDVLIGTIASLPASDLPRLGGEKKQLGTHSVRKGAASYCAGLINGPSMVQVFLRAGWSLGNVQDRYLFAGAGGDQLTGRALSCLPFNDSSFSLLPPHFGKEGLDRVEWPLILPLYARLPETFKRALPCLLASICYHEQWLRSMLPAHHPLFASYLFASGCVSSLKEFVLAGRSRCIITGMQATGIPPHLAMSNELTDVVKQTQVLREELLAKCTELPSELVSVMLSKFTVNGAIPVTADDLKALLNNVLTQMRAEMRAELREALPAATHAAASPQPTDPLGDPDPVFLKWTWGGKFHMVPEGWRFPSTDVKATWNLWHFGHVQDKIRPLRLLKEFDLINEAQATLLSKCSGVMKAIAQEMVEMKVVQSLRDVEKLSAVDSSAAFDRALLQLIERVKPGSTRQPGRWMEMKVTTLYDHMKGRKRKRQDEQQAEAGQAGAAQAGDAGGGHRRQRRRQRREGNGGREQA